MGMAPTAATANALAPNNTAWAQPFNVPSATPLPATVSPATPWLATQPLGQDVYTKQATPVTAAVALPSLPPAPPLLPPTSPPLGQGLPPAPEVLAPWLYFPLQARPTQPEGSASQTQALQQNGSGNAFGNPVGSEPQPANPSNAMPDGGSQSQPDIGGQAPQALPDAGAKPLESKSDAASPDGKPSSNGASQEALIHGFEDTLRRSLNARLEDPDWQKRGLAANDFFLTLQASPALAKNPFYKPYVDAFALKILRDPMAAVHTPILLAIQTGYYSHPSPAVLKELHRLEGGRGMLGLEPQQASDALYSLKQIQHKERIENAEQEASALAAAPLAPMTPPEAMPPDETGGGLSSLSTPPLAASIPLQAKRELQAKSEGLRRLWPFNRQNQTLQANATAMQPSDGQRLNLLSAGG